MRSTDQLEEFPLYADLEQQHKQNEQILKYCELQRLVLARQQAALDAKAQAAKRNIQKQSAA